MLLCEPFRNADTLKRLHEAEKKLKEQQTQAYINIDLSNKERELGNQVDASSPYLLVFRAIPLICGPMGRFWVDSHCSQIER